MDEYRMTPPTGAELTLSVLGVVPRILLATDGTLTHIIEAYAEEPIRLVKLSHSLVVEPTARQRFGLSIDERALRRVILLRGSESGATFIHAESVVMLDRLPGPVADALLNTERPIGKLLAENRTETFREIIAVWQERNVSIAKHFHIKPADLLLARTYRILSGGKPLAWITETFPEKFQAALHREARHRRDRRRSSPAPPPTPLGPMIDPAGGLT